MDIKADVRKIEQLKDYFFSVPDYQREYVWQADIHVDRFLQDINEVFQPNSREQSSYFIGSAIILKTPADSFDVIDGQQRLTTIVIALCAMRQALKDLPNATGNTGNTRDEFLKIVQELLYKYDIGQLQYIPRLSLQYEESKDYLTRLITGGEYTDIQTPSIKKMQEAYTAVSAFLKAFQVSEELINFIRYFLHHVEMVIITPDSLSSALKIFETINERGVGLNAMDLLKNLLFSHAGDAEFAAIKQTWKEMLKDIQNSGEGDNPLRFLRYFLMGRYHNGVLREDQIYHWMISPEGVASTGYRQYPVRFATELKVAAKRYALLVKATTASNADAAYPYITGIGYLSGKTSRQHLVLLMALPETANDEIIGKLAKNIESLVFYYAANRILTKYYEQQFATWAKTLREAKSVAALQTFLKEDFRAQLEEQQTKFNAQFSSKFEGDFSPQYRVKYILGKLDGFIRTHSKLPANDFSFYQHQQIEHILPQKGENIPDATFPQPFDYNNTVYRFGNITLLEAPINQSLNKTNDISSNKWFETKRAAYLNSSILLTRTFSDVPIGNDTAFNSFTKANLLSFTEWNMSTVGDRQEMIRKLCVQVWKLDA